MRTQGAHAREHASVGVMTTERVCDFPFLLEFQKQKKHTTVQIHGTSENYFGNSEEM